MVKAVMQQLITYGAVKRGALGIKLSDVRPEEAETNGLVNAHGVRVADVAHGSPAEHAGIKAGDIVVSINGVALESAAQLRNAIALLRVGQTVELRVLHRGGVRSVSVSITGHESAG
jgi:S1-C subfamily serine protease